MSNFSYLLAFFLFLSTSLSCHPLDTQIPGTELTIRMLMQKFCSHTCGKIATYEFDDDSLTELKIVQELHKKLLAHQKSPEFETLVKILKFKPSDYFSIENQLQSWELENKKYPGDDSDLTEMTKDIIELIFMELPGKTHEALTTFLDKQKRFLGLLENAIEQFSPTTEPASPSSTWSDTSSVAMSPSPKDLQHPRVSVLQKEPKEPFAFSPIQITTKTTNRRSPHRKSPLSP